MEAIRPQFKLVAGQIWCIVGRKALHRHNRYLDIWVEQNHRHIRQRYPPTPGVAQFESDIRFCAAFEESRNYLTSERPEKGSTASERRETFSTEWPTLLAELSA